MSTLRNALREANIRLSRLAGVAILGATCLLLTGLAACASDEPVGTTKTTTKRTIETPTEKTTITETHTKDTKLYP